MERFKELFVRLNSGRPILRAEMWTYPVGDSKFNRVDKVFNPAAEKCQGDTVLLVRAMDRRAFSHLSLVRSKDGITDWQIPNKPTLQAEPQYGEFKKGLEDPRMVWVEELEEYIIACVSFRDEYEDKLNGITLIGTKDFLNFRRISKPLGPQNKNASLFPRRIKGSFALIHRPIVSDRAQIAVSFSGDLKNWGGEQSIFSSRPWGWDSEKVGLGCPPIETEQGWLVIHHGFGGKANRFVYQVGLALLDLEDLRLIRRGEEWVFGPKKGDDEIVFPCGFTLGEEDKKLRIYYGSGDSKISLAQANLDEVLDYIMSCPVE